RDLHAGRERGESEISAATGRGQTRYPANLRVLHGPGRLGRAAAAKPAVAGRPAREYQGEGLPGVRRRYLHAKARGAATCHGVLVLVARVLQPVGLLRPGIVETWYACAAPLH